MTTGFRILVTGGRDFNIQAAMHNALSLLSPTEIINGAAKGADTLSTNYANSLEIKLTNYPVTAQDWQTYGKSAGFRRNEVMLLDSKPDIVLAFPGGNGTNHMKTTAHNYGYKVLLANNQGQITFDTRLHNMHTTKGQCPDGFVRIDRNTLWGNQYKLTKTTNPETVMSYYEQHLREYIENNNSYIQQLSNLAGRTLACWCTPQKCHGEILAYYANHFALQMLPTPAKILGFH